MGIDVGEIINSCNRLPKTTYRRYDAGRCAAEILDTVPAINRFIRSEMRAHRGSDLSVPQFRALGFLIRNRCASLAEVAEFMGLSTPAASRLIERLVRNGQVIRRIPATNRRRVELSATRRGRSTWEAARKATRDRLAEVVALLTPSQREEVRQAMRILLSRFQPEVPGKEQGRSR